jgi:hypothetical protein
MWHAWVRAETCTGFLMGKPERKRPLVSPRPRWEDGIKLYVRGLAGGVWSGFTWLRIRIVGGLL